MLTTPFVGSVLIRIGRRRALYIGFWIATAATFMQFASAAFITNDVIFYGISLVVRCVEGVAEALAINALYSICCLEFPENNGWYQGQLNLAMGVGLMMGPCITNLMIENLDYANTLIAFGVFLLFASSFGITALPERLDLKHSNWRGNYRNVVSIPYRSFFKNLRVVMALVAVSICATCHFYLNSDINQRIVSDDGAANVYLVQSLMAIMFAITSILIGSISDRVDHRFIFSTSFVMLAGALFTLDRHEDVPGPVNYLAVSLIGCSLAAVVVPTIPELIESMKTELRI